MKKKLYVVSTVLWSRVTFMDDDELLETMRRSLKVYHPVDIEPVIVPPEARGELSFDDEGHIVVKGIT